MQPLYGEGGANPAKGPNPAEGDEIAGPSIQPRLSRRPCRRLSDTGRGWDIAPRRRRGQASASQVAEAIRASVHVCRDVLRDVLNSASVRGSLARNASQLCRAGGFPPMAMSDPYRIRGSPICRRRPAMNAASSMELWAVTFVVTSK
jgi:hypothetical protein